MGEDNSSLGDSLIMGLAEALVGEDKADELRRETSRFVGDVDGEEFDALVFAGLAAAGQSREEVIQEMNGRDPERPPAIHLREIEAADGGVAGVRCLVSAPASEVSVYRGEGHVLIRQGERSTEQPLGFEPGEIEWADAGEGITEFVVRPAEADESDADGDEATEDDDPVVLPDDAVEVEDADDGRDDDPDEDDGDE